MENIRNKILADFTVGDLDDPTILNGLKYSLTYLDRVKLVKFIADVKIKEEEFKSIPRV